ncbi:hypothetical protein G6F46_011842 [Rhizopus delemar]|uniref:Transcription factor domain-containing protein n=2 Tax=Rhizopus TaxID=4842 RepID=A0A9P7CI52_9FUNG|nr:hypothetical protein G6F55_009151 [Rhizopus delemar]KAG1534648.1 hypothetical protein G6F51_011979 [Rhizopus arrhizus]KAG1488841.1 hypothetical protein G6F54_011853 [Rhizopus delemar]KAG1498216.1 hypothetical protein G6F53_011791 [Rhizopus delemar]KAG1511234.1 hypothetical protein G6F52_010701 [Rhizopus delemar]
MSNDHFLIDSPQSTEELLFEYLQPQIQRQHDQSEQCSPITIAEYDPYDYYYYSLNNVLSSTNQTITMQFSSFSDLQTALLDLENPDPSFPYSQKQQQQQHQRVMYNPSCEKELIYPLLPPAVMEIPASVRTTIENSNFMDFLMYRAIQHWCCIGFKVAPISVDLIKDWRRAPQPIVYCIASISLVSLIEPERDCSKQAAVAFYEQARAKMDDVFLDDMKPQMIQSYFCLSYTSNLLRLYEQQRIWGGLASISLQHLAKRAVVDPLTLGCWLRWYYVDAWMSLTLNQDCLLPDLVPWLQIERIQEISISNEDDGNQLYSFGCLTFYMRRYIRLLHSGKIFASPYERIPSRHYYEITECLISWYQRLPLYTSSPSRLHLHLCYHSMRLVILYQFLRPQHPPPDDILIDCLETNLELLQALQHLKEMGCDQSTYHHMFYTIHNTAKRIHQYNLDSFKHISEELLKINLTFLKRTQGYIHDVFKMKFYAEQIQNQFKRMNIKEDTENQQVTTSQILVFKKDTSAVIKRKKKISNKVK